MADLNSLLDVVWEAAIIMKQAGEVERLRIVLNVLTESSFGNGRSFKPHLPLVGRHHQVDLPELTEEEGSMRMIPHRLTKGRLKKLLGFLDERG